MRSREDHLQSGRHICEYKQVAKCKQICGNIEEGGNIWFRQSTREFVDAIGWASQGVTGAVHWPCPA